MEVKQHCKFLGCAIHRDGKQVKPVKPMLSWILAKKLSLPLSAVSGYICQGCRYVLYKLKDDLQKLQLSKRTMRRALLQLTRKPYVILDRELTDSFCRNMQLPSHKKRKQDKHGDDVGKNLCLENSQDTVQQIDEQIANDKGILDASAVVGITTSDISADGNTAYQIKIQERNLSKKKSSDSAPQNSVQEAEEKDARIDNIAISIKNKDVSLKKSNIREVDFSKNKSLSKRAQKFVHQSGNKCSLSKSKTVLFKGESTSVEKINTPVNQKCFLLESKSLETIAPNLSKIHYSDSKISIDSSKSNTVYVKEGKQKEKERKAKTEIKQEFFSSNTSINVSKLKTCSKTITTADKNQDVSFSEKYTQTSHVDSKLLAEQIDMSSIKIPVKIDINKIETDLNSTSQQEDSDTVEMKSTTTLKRKMHAEYLNESISPKKIQKNNEANKHLTVNNTEIFDYDTVSEDEQVYENDASENREKITKHMTKKKDMYKLLKLKTEKRKKRKNKMIKKIRQRFKDLFRNSMKADTDERNEEHEILLQCLKKKEQQFMERAFQDITTDEEIENICKRTPTTHEISVNALQKDMENTLSTKVNNSVIVIDTKNVINDTCAERSEDIVSSTTEMNTDENMNKDILHLYENTEKGKYVASAETEEVNEQNVIQNFPACNQGCSVEKFGLINEDMKMQEDVTSNSALSTVCTQELTFSNTEEKDDCDVKNLLQLTDNGSNTVSIEMIDHASLTTPQLEKGSSEDTCTVHKASFMPIQTSIPSSQSNDNRSSEDHSTDDDNLDHIEVEIKIKPKSKSRIYQKFSMKAPWSAVNSCMENLCKLKNNPNSLGELFQMNYKESSENSGYENASSNVESDTSGRLLNVNQDVTINSVDTQEVVCNSSHITKDNANHSSQQQSSQDDTTLNDNKDKIEHNQEKEDECIQSVEQEKTRITAENNFASTCDMSNLGKQSLQTFSNDKEKADEQQQDSRNVTVLTEDTNVTERNQREKTGGVQFVEQEKARVTAENSFASACDTSNLGKQSLQTFSDDKEKAGEQQQDSRDVTVLTEDTNVTERNQREKTGGVQFVEQEKARMTVENSFASACDTSNLGKQSLQTFSDDKEKAGEQQQDSRDVTVLTEDTNVTERNQREKTGGVQSVEQEKARVTAENSFASARDTFNLGKQSLQTFSDDKEKVDEQQQDSRDITVLTKDTNITERNREEKTESVQSIEQEKTRVTVENSFASACDTSNLEKRSLQTFSDDKEKADEQQQDSRDVTVLTENTNVTERNQREKTGGIQSVEQEKARVTAENSFASTCDTFNLGKQSLQTFSNDKEKANEQQQDSRDVTVLTEDTNVTGHNQREKTGGVQSVEQEKARVTAENSFASTCDTSNLGKQSLQTVSNDKEKANEQQQDSRDIIVLTEDTNVTERNRREKTGGIEQEKTWVTAENSSESAKSACVAPDLGKQLPNASAETLTRSRVRVRSSAELGSCWYSPSMNPNASFASNSTASVPLPSIPRPPPSYNTIINKSLHTEEPQYIPIENISSEIRKDTMNLIQNAITIIWANIVCCRNICQQKLNIWNVNLIWSNLREILLKVYNLKVYLQTEDDNHVINYVNQYLLINQPITVGEIYKYSDIVNQHSHSKLIDHPNATHVSPIGTVGNAPYGPVSSASVPNVNAQPFPGNTSCASSGIRMSNPGNLQSSTTSYPCAMAPNINRQQFSENTVNFSHASQSRQPIPNIHQSIVPITIYSIPMPNANQQQSFGNMSNISHTSLSGVPTSNIYMSVNVPANQGNTNAPPTTNKRYSYVAPKTTTSNTATVSVTNVQRDSQAFPQASLQVNSRICQSMIHEMANRNVQQTVQTTPLNRSSTMNPTPLRTGVTMGNIRPGNSSMNLQTQRSQVPSMRMPSLSQQNPLLSTILNPIVVSQPNVCAQACAQDIPLNLNMQNSRQSQHINLPNDISIRPVNLSNNNTMQNVLRSVLTTNAKNPNSQNRVRVSNKPSSIIPQQNERQEISGAHNVLQDLSSTVRRTSVSQEPNSSQNITPNAPSQGGRSALLSARAKRLQSNETINYNFNLQILTDIQKIVLQRQLHLYFCMDECRHLLKQQEFEKIQSEKKILYSFNESLYNFINNMLNAQKTQKHIKETSQNNVSKSIPVQENKIQSSTDKITKTPPNQSNNSACDKMLEKQPLRSSDSNISTSSKSMTVENNLSIEVQNKESFITSRPTIIQKSYSGTKVKLQKQTKDTPKMQFKQHVSTDVGKRSEKSLSVCSSTPKESTIAEAFRKNSEMEAQDKTKTVKSPGEKLHDKQLSGLCSSFLQNTSNLTQDISTGKITVKDKSEVVNNNVNIKRPDNATTENMCKISNVIKLNNSAKNDTASQSTNNTRDQNKKVYNNRACDIDNQIFGQHSQDRMPVKENIEKSKTDMEIQFDSSHIRTSTPFTSNNTSELISLIKECQSVETLQASIARIDEYVKILPEFSSNAQEEDPTNSGDESLDSSGRLYIDESAGRSSSDSQQQQHDKVSSSKEESNTSESFDAVRCGFIETISKSSLLKDNKVNLTDIYQSLVTEVQDAKRLNKSSSSKPEEIVPEFCLNAQQEDPTNEQINNSKKVQDGISESSGRLYINKSARRLSLNSQEEQRGKASFPEESKLDTSRNLSRSFDAVRCEAIEIVPLSSYLENNEVDLTVTYQSLAQNAKRLDEPSPIKSEETVSKFCLITQQEDPTNEQINNFGETHDGVLESPGRMYVDESATRSSQQEQRDKVSFSEDNLNMSLDLPFDAMKCDSIETTVLSSILERSDIADICRNLMTLKSELEEEQFQKILSFEISKDASNTGESTVQSIGTVKQSEDTEEKNIKVDTHSDIKIINERLKHVSEQKYHTESQISSCTSKNDFTAEVKEDAKNDIFKDDINECSSVKSDDSDIIIVPNIVNVRSISPSLFEKIDNIDKLPQDNLETLNEKGETKSLNISVNPEISNDIEDKPCLRCKRKSTVYCQGCLKAHYCCKRCSSLHWNAEHYKHCKSRHDLTDT